MLPVTLREFGTHFHWNNLSTSLAVWKVSRRQLIHCAADVRTDGLRNKRLAGAAGPKQQQTAHRARCPTAHWPVLLRKASCRTCANHFAKCLEVFGGHEATVADVVVLLSIQISSSNPRVFTLHDVVIQEFLLSTALDRVLVHQYNRNYFSHRTREINRVEKKGRWTRATWMEGTKRLARTLAGGTTLTTFSFRKSSINQHACQVSQRLAGQTEVGFTLP